MPNKFKVGDIVTCVNARDVSNITEGKDYEVTYLGGLLVHLVSDRGEDEGYFPHRFKLKENTRPMADYKFKVGDKVCQSDESPYQFGTGNRGTKDVIGTVKSLPDEGSEFYVVDFGYVGYDASDWAMSEGELELVQSAERINREILVADTTPASTSGKIKSDGGSSAYYQFPDGATELNDLIEHKDMSFARGNMFKALYRLGEKEGIDVGYDLNKMQLFLDRLKEMHKKGKRP